MSSFEEWAEEAELSEETITLLNEHGFKSIKRCKKLNDEMIQELFCKLPQGEKLALQDAVAELSITRDASSTGNTVQRSEQLQTTPTATATPQAARPQGSAAAFVELSPHQQYPEATTKNQYQFSNMAESLHYAPEEGVARSTQFKNGLAAAGISFDVGMNKGVQSFHLRPTPTRLDQKDKENEIIKNEYGRPPSLPGREVSILLVGETGTGKTSMLGTIVNYVMGVTSKDNFRVSIVEKQENEMDTDEAESQTQWITIYTIYPNRFVDYTLHIIDTPGFGDTRGRQQDELLVKKMSAFFHHDTMAITVNAVCFTFKGNTTRLTENEKYIVEQITGLFGKDIENNIIVFATFWPYKKDPPLMNTLKASRVPFNTIYNVDNIPIDELDPDTLHIAKNNLAIKTFFDKMPQPKSLQLSAQVLEERDVLLTNVKSLSTLVTRTLTKFSSHEQILKEIDQHGSAKSKLIGVHIDENVMEKLLTDNHHVNCPVCEISCGGDYIFSLSIWNRIGKVLNYKCGCTHEYGDHVSEKCIWKRGVRSAYKTKDELMKKYNTKGNDLNDLKTNIQVELDADMSEMNKLIKSLKSSTNKVATIALRPQIAATRVIDGLIEQEKQQDLFGKERRVAFLTKIKADFK